MKYLLLILPLIVIGCNTVLAPGSRNAPDQTHDWSSDLSYGLNTDPADLSEWWRTLNDPLLNQLIEIALAENLNLGISASRVREARAQRGVAGASQFPTLSTSGGYQRTKQGTRDSGDLYSSGFDAGWELDFFGRVRNNVEAADQDLKATEEAYYDTRISLIAEVALNYTELRSFEKRLAIAESNVKVQEESLRITQARFKNEIISELDVKQAETNLLNTQAGIPQLTSGLNASRNRLSTLLGKKPGELAGLLENAKDRRKGVIPLPPGEIAVGIPADIMRRRPDIRQAERQLAAQSARVGVAKAELYPKFRLTGNLSFSATDATNLFSATSRAMSIGPSFEWNIFSAGSIRNNIKVQGEKQQQSLLDYEQTILGALEEIENALTDFATENDRHEKLSSSTQSADLSARLADKQYKAGLTDFTNVLDSQRTLLSQEDQQAISEAQITSNMIRLYKALGGGWSAEALKQVEVSEAE